MTEAYEWQGGTVIGDDGEKIGTVNDIYLDHRTGKPEWATVAGGLFGMKSHFVPLANATPAGEDEDGRVPVTKDQVQSAPGVDPDGELSEREEQRLFEHYGVPIRPRGAPPQKALRVLRVVPAWATMRRRIVLAEQVRRTTR